MASLILWDSPPESVAERPIKSEIGQTDFFQEAKTVAYLFDHSAGDLHSPVVQREVR